MAKSTTPTDESATTDNVFVALHSVGVHTPGEVIHFVEKTVAEAGIDIDRLLRLGAIRPATAEEAANAVPIGESDPDRAIRPIPDVPHDPLAAQAVAAATEHTVIEESNKAADEKPIE